MLHIILDAAHGIDTPGKRSPDGKHREYLWSRQRIASLTFKLKAIGFEVFESNPYEKEIGLGNRIKVTNTFCKNTKSLFLSLHNDAAGNGEWMTATGYSVYTTPGVTKSDEFAQILMNEFKTKFPSLKARVDLTDGDLDKEENFAVLKCDCPAVLVEWLFQDNKNDVALLLDKVTNDKYEDCIIEAIKKINTKWQ